MARVAQPPEHAPLELCAVTAVTISRIARKQGFARVMTAQQLAAAAQAGAEVAALGMFDQGFYDQVGFGTGAYEHMIRFDPATLQVDVPFRVPARLTKDNWADVHGAMVERMKHHGAVVLNRTRFADSREQIAQTCPERFSQYEGDIDNPEALFQEMPQVLLLNDSFILLILYTFLCRSSEPQIR